MNIVKGDFLYTNFTSDSGDYPNHREVAKIRKKLKHKNAEWKDKYKGIKIKFEEDEFGPVVKIFLRKKMAERDVEKHLDTCINDIISLYLEIYEMRVENTYFGILSGKIRYSVLAGNGYLEGTINAGSEDERVAISHLYFYNKSGTAELNKLNLVSYFCDVTNYSKIKYVVSNFDRLKHGKIKT